MDNNYKSGGQGSAALLEPPGAPSESSAPNLQAVDEGTNGSTPSPVTAYIASGASPAPEVRYPTETPTHPAWQQVQQQQYGQRRSNTALLVVVGALLLFVVMLLFSIGIATRAFFNFVGTATVGEVRTETQSVQLGGANSVDARVEMGVGNLAISGGASELLDAGFTYNIEEWKPEVAYSVKAGDKTGSLLVEQPATGIPLTSNARYEWDLRFANGVPLDLEVNMGAGEQDLDLSGLSLKRLEVTGGTGNTSVDLTGVARQSFDARVINSVGNTTVKLPSDTGVKVTLVQGLGNIDANGLKVDGDTYTNDAYGNSDETINLYVETATGNITLEQEK